MKECEYCPKNSYFGKRWEKTMKRHKRRSLKQIFCFRERKKIAVSKYCSMSLYQCQKCKVYFEFHHGIWLGFYTADIDVDEWKPVDA